MIYLFVNLVEPSNYATLEQNMKQNKNEKEDFPMQIISSLFKCSECKKEINIYNIKTKKHIDDLHEKYLCSDCSDKEYKPIKKRRKIIVEM